MTLCLGYPPLPGPSSSAGAIALGTGAAMVLCRTLWTVSENGGQTLSYSATLCCMFAFVACLGFCPSYNVQGMGALLCALGGAMGWTVSGGPTLQRQPLLVQSVGGGGSGCLCRVHGPYPQVSASSYLVISMFPLVPGLSVYRAMDYSLQGDTQQFWIPSFAPSALPAACPLARSSCLPPWPLYTIIKGGPADAPLPTVLLDADMTLLDFQRSEQAALSRVLNSHGLPAARMYWTPTPRSIAPSGKRWPGGGRPRLLVVERFAALQRVIGGQEDPRQLNAHYSRALGEEAHLLPGALDFCKRLRQAGLTLAIATNGLPSAQWGRYRRTGLDQVIPHLFVSMEIGAQNPCQPILTGFWINLAYPTGARY